MSDLSNWYQDYQNKREAKLQEKIKANPSKYGIEANTSSTGPTDLNNRSLGMGVPTDNLFGSLSSATSTEEEKMKALDKALAEGKITKEQHTSMINDVSNNRDIEGLDKLNTNGKAFDINNMPYFNPTGSDLNSRVYNLGRALGAPKGTKNKTFDIIGNSLSLGLGLAREGMSGYANQKMDSYAQDWYSKKKQERQYTDASQTQNTNTIGGQDFKYGGLFKFEDGGEMFQASQEESQSPEEMQETQSEQGQEPQQVESSRVEQIAQQLVQKLGDLKSIDAYLKQQGVDQQTYQEIMQIAQQMLSGEGQDNEDNGEEEELPKMKGGGSFKHQVGDSIDFTHKGKSYKGKISKIENGKIFL